MIQSYRENKVIVLGVKKTFWNAKQAFVFLITQSGLLEGWEDGEGKGKESSSWFLIELNLPKSAEAGNVQFSSSLKAASCQSDAYEPAQLREGTCLGCLHRNPMTAAWTLLQPLLAALNAVARCFDFRHASRPGPTFPCHHKSAQRDTQHPRFFKYFSTKIYMLCFTWDWLYLFI